MSDSTSIAPEVPHSTSSLETLSRAIDEMSKETPSKAGSDGSKAQEETLESHEVIELQTFIERKAWIEEKIRFLERMPPIEVFVGLNAVKSSAEEVPELPSRAELQKWIAEHDVIEKETDIFDKGELKKLRNFTRAATQRNLSPEDTDLIELTLTTIYELDKLLHLLRDRSDNLDLLGIRMTWEEHRTNSWADRRKIIADLNTFLETRARFSPSVYETVTQSDFAGVERRGSVASLASVASASSDSSFSHFGLSRSTRYKLAELLSRDGATIGTRVTSLKLGSVPAAGKALDKLIDHSRKPVPEVLLDEQDHLEEKCINEMEHIGKFVMNMVMQWRKADEIYIETMKDLNAAQNLLEEIEVAHLQHPSGRSSSNFASRADALIKRLLLRGNPSSTNSSFPRPVHHLFPSQPPYNEQLAESLSADIMSATTAAREAEAAAKEYKAKYEAVKQVESLKEAAGEVADTFTRIIDRLQNGVPGGEGDGTTPSLMSTDCLDPTAHSVFLALLPSMLEELDNADTLAQNLLRTLPAAILKIDFPGLDPDFRANASAEGRRLSDLRVEALRIREEVTTRVGRLREARKIWSAMDVGLKDLESIRREVVDVMDGARWRQETTVTHGAPPTPESPPNQPLPLPSSHDTHVSHLRERVTALEMQLSGKVYKPLSTLSETLEEPLKVSLTQASDSLRSHVDRVKQTIDLLESVRKQSSAMTVIRDESNALQLKVEDLINRYGIVIQELLDHSSDDSSTGDASELEVESNTLRSEAYSFTEGLGRRIPLIVSKSPKRSFTRRSLSSLDLRNFTSDPEPIELPFEVQSLDDAVRADCNTYSMRLNGQVRKLEQTASHLHVTQIAMEVDQARLSVLEVIETANKHLSSMKETLEGTTNQSNVLQIFQDLLTRIESSTSHHANIERSLTAYRNGYKRMEAAAGSHGSAFQDSLLSSRKKGVDDVEKRFAAWESDIKAFKALVLEQERAEIARLEAERLAEAERLRLEQERIAAEEAEKARIEQEKEEEERRRREEEERLQEQLRLEAERDAAAEKERREREAAEKARLEEQRLAEERRLQAEQERMAAEGAERTRLEQERSDMEKKLKAAEIQLAEERRIHAEKEQLAKEEAEKRRQAADEERRRRLASEVPEEDVFGLQTSPGGPSNITEEMKEILAKVAKLRKRLRSIGIQELVRPASGSASLPDPEQIPKIRRELARIETDMKSLPESVTVVSVNIQLKSCRAELDASRDMLGHLDRLTIFAERLASCDAALSDLLEHIDSYPVAPLGPLSSSYSCPKGSSPETQLSGRLEFTKSLVDSLSASFEAVSSDPRTIAEKERILQTWSELEDMGNDRICGRRSRPNSVASSTHNSSGRNSRSSLGSGRSNLRKSNGYATLSASSSKPSAPPRGRLKVPASGSRRAFSGSDEPSDRSLSRASVTSSTTHRSASGSSLYGTTFASRQRTTSLTPIAGTPTRVHTRSQTSTSQKTRSESPAISDISTVTRTSRSSLSGSTWSRAPRVSFPNVPRTTPKKASASRKTYVANPKSKLDVAVGKVVNNLPVGINIEGVAGSWKDQSGKYWIGDQDPKLCFCRILRSQTVMVRVGGGWCELSKFIRNHFADSFRLLSATPPNQLPLREEKWISSASLLDAVKNSPPRAPRTPEPGSSPFGSPSMIPSFALQTPSSKSPRSFMTTTPTSSPLTPLQFMRRADPDAPFLRPETPSRPPTAGLRTMPSTPSSRQGVWRP
ncbi:hypothetical protein AAF712_002146 [Marasmius tenuissimus]|uniref:GAR domain-containing protein n=1 Tax=Marasmius tenuissimus TaxID=585030 RepID=A0ABR3ABN4_9AGAR